MGVRGNGPFLPFFANLYLLHKVHDAIDDICGGECKAISGFNRSLGSCYFVRIAIEIRQVSAPEFNYKLTINPVLLNTRANDATVLPVKIMRNVSEI